MTTSMKSLRTSLKLLIVALALVWGPVASAHHSFALFDMARLTTLEATVREWKWTNPHTWLIVEVKRPNGTSEVWSLVGSSPNMMSRWGWKASDIKTGDKLKIDIHPARDGKPIGALRNVFLANGKVLQDPAGETGQALANGPDNLPSKPQGTPYK